MHHYTANTGHSLPRPLSPPKIALHHLSQRLQPPHLQCGERGFESPTVWELWTWLSFCVPSNRSLRAHTTCMSSLSAVNAVCAVVWSNPPGARNRRTFSLMSCKYFGSRTFSSKEWRVSEPAVASVWPPLFVAAEMDGSFRPLSFSNSSVSSRYRQVVVSKIASSLAYSASSVGAHLSSMYLSKIL